MSARAVVWIAESVLSDEMMALMEHLQARRRENSRLERSLDDTHGPLDETEGRTSMS